MIDWLDRWITDYLLSRPEERGVALCALIGLIAGLAVWIVER